MDALALLDDAVVALSSLSVVELEDAQALAIALEQAAGRLRGIASQALAVVAAADPEGVSWWWRDSVGISGQAAGHAVRRAVALSALPAVASAVVEGALSLEQAGALVPLVGRLPENELTELQPTLIETCTGRTVDSIGQWVRGVLAVHAESYLDDEQAAVEKNRHLTWRLDPDGAVRGRFVLSAEKAEPFLTVIEALARRQGLDDHRPSGQRRADSLIEMAEIALRHADLPDTGGQRTQVTYVMPADWAARCYAAEPALGAWTGPQTRGFMEALLCDARISRVLLNEPGQVVGLESLTDQITLAQRRAISARDHHCVARGCTRPPGFCDVHHLVSREDGGPTEVGNLVLLCRRHHVLWHRGALTLRDLRVPWLDRPDEPQVDAAA